MFFWWFFPGSPISCFVNFGINQALKSINPGLYASSNIKPALNFNSPSLSKINPLSGVNQQSNDDSKLSAAVSPGSFANGLFSIAAISIKVQHLPSRKPTNNMRSSSKSLLQNGRSLSQVLLSSKLPFSSQGLVVTNVNIWKSNYMILFIKWH